MVVPDLFILIVRQGHKRHRLGFRVQRVYGLQIVQNDIEGRPAKRSGAIDLQVDPLPIAIRQNQHLTIAGDKDNSSPPAGHCRQKVAVGLDNQTRDQAWRQVVVSVAEAQQVVWPLAKEGTARWQSLRNEVALFLWYRHTEAEADLRLLHHIQNEFMPLRRIGVRIKPLGQVLTEKFAVLINRARFLQNAVDRPCQPIWVKQTDFAAGGGRRARLVPARARRSSRAGGATGGARAVHPHR